jgi:hypothetical protein
LGINPASPPDQFSGGFEPIVPADSSFFETRANVKYVLEIFGSRDLETVKFQFDEEESVSSNANFGAL